jgi:dTMP kinase
MLTREPGGTEIGQSIRQILLDRNLDRDPVTELLLMCADRAEHVRSVLRPALERGEFVISDRYASSTRAYQGAGLGLNSDLVERAIGLATGGLEPDLTVLLDIDSAAAQNRRQQRSSAQNDIDRRSVEFHERVRAGFLEQARSHPEKWAVVDASRPLDEELAEVLRVVGVVLSGKAAN